MDWQQIDGYHVQSDQGHRVCATKGADGWRYSAWSAPADPELTYWQWNAKHARQWRYPRGEAVPRRCTLLGVYLTAQEARARCEAEMMAIETTAEGTA